MSTPTITPEVLSLNGSLKIRLTAEREGKVVDIDELNVGSARARAQYVNRVAPIIDCPPADVDAVVLEKAAEAMDAATEAAKKPDDSADPREAALAETPPEVLEEAEAMLRAPDLMDRIAADVALLGVAGEPRLALAIYIIGTSRFLRNPLAAHVHGASSGGKSFIVNTIASMMPEEGVLKAHDITDQSFYYLPAGSLRHKFVACGEREREHPTHDRARFGSKAFREMIADGELKKCVTIKGEDGRPATVLITQEGPIAFVETSTAGTVHEEDRTRLLMLTVNEAQRQTEQVIRAEQDRLAGRGPDVAAQQRIRLVHQTAQRLLDPEVEVIIPWAHMLKLPCDKVAARRAMGHVGSFIQAVAFLRQKQKRIRCSNGRKTVLADRTDYQIFLDLMREPLADAFQLIDGQMRATLETIDQKFPAKLFTRDNLALALGVGPEQAGRRVKPLVACGLVDKDESRRPHRYSRTETQIAEVTVLTLPDPEDIPEAPECPGEDGEDGASPARSPGLDPVANPETDVDPSARLGVEDGTDARPAEGDQA